MDTFAQIDVQLAAFVSPFYLVIFEVIKTALKARVPDLDLHKRLSALIMVVLGTMLGLGIGWMIDNSSDASTNALTGFAVAAATSGLYSSLKAMIEGSKPDPHVESLRTDVVLLDQRISALVSPPPDPAKVQQVRAEVSVDTAAAEAALRRTKASFEEAFRAVDGSMPYRPARSSHPFQTLVATDHQQEPVASVSELMALGFAGVDGEAADRDESNDALRGTPPI